MWTAAALDGQTLALDSCDMYVIRADLGLPDRPLPAAPVRRGISHRPPRGSSTIRPTGENTSPEVGCDDMSDSPADITRLLRSAAGGERRDVDALMSAIYEDMRRLAIGHMRAERANHTLQPTALVHEAYIRLLAQHSTDWKDRVHFFAIASRVIRRILVDHAREKLAAKRGGGGGRIALDDVEVAAPTRDVDLVALDLAMNELAAIDPTQAQIVEMRYFGGLTIEEIAEALSIGKRSVDRHWAAARAWLCFRLEGGDADAGHG
jgi:RNA polymerase sigma-70 factor (ECF subfamily)